MKLDRWVKATFLAAGMLTANGAVLADSLQEIQQKGKIRIAIAGEIPYGYVDLDGQAKGVGPDVARHVVKQLGIEDIEWKTTRFGSLIPGLRANRFDMIAAEMAILPQRCEHVDFSQPNSSYGEGLLVAKGNPHGVHSYEHFAKHEATVAIVAAADQLETLQALGVPQSRMMTLSSNSDAISTVATNRATAYAATASTVRQLAAKSDKVEAVEDFSDPVVNGQEVRSWGAFTFAPGSDLGVAFDAELAKFKQTPEWVNIMKRHGFSPADIQASFEKTREQLCAE